MKQRPQTGKTYGGNRGGIGDKNRALRIDTSEQVRTPMNQTRLSEQL